MRDFAVVDEMQRVLFEDQVRVHHPVSATVESPQEIEDLFDLITYNKGIGANKSSKC